MVEVKDNDVKIIVTQAIADALMVPIDQVVSGKRLISDLEAESIDIVDIRFRVEERIGFKIDQNLMIEALGDNLSEEEFNNRLTVKYIIQYVSTLVEQRN